MEEQQYHLVEQRLDLDVTAWRVFQGKLASYSKARAAKKQEWNYKRHKFSREAASEYVKTKITIQQCQNQDSIVNVYNNVVAEFSQKHNIPRDNILTMGIVNWVAPSMIHHEHFEMQANIISMLCNGHVHNIMPILMPQFSYKRGQLYIADEMVNKVLSAREINVDAKFGLVFEGRPDARDSRRLIYDGRVAVPHGISEDGYIWTECQLMKGKTDPAQMVSSRDLETIEEIGDEVLPSTTDSDGTVKGAGKWAQVGEDAMVKLINAALKDCPLTHKHGLIIWEINPGWGNALDAYIRIERAWNFPSHQHAAGHAAG